LEQRQAPGRTLPQLFGRTSAQQLFGKGQPPLLAADSIKIQNTYEDYVYRMLEIHKYRSLARKHKNIQDKSCPQAPFKNVRTEDLTRKRRQTITDIHAGSSYANDDIHLAPGRNMAVQIARRQINTAALLAAPSSTTPAR
jgi:hypothetical protein